MRIVFVVVWALLVSPLSGQDTPGVDPQSEARDLSLAMLSLTTAAVGVDNSHRGLVTGEGQNGRDVRGELDGKSSSERSLVCVPRFSDIFAQLPGRKIAIGPINGTKNLMVTSAPGTGLPLQQNWYAAGANLAEPFIICNKLYQTIFPGMVGYTFRAFSNAVVTDCLGNGTDFYVILKLYNAVNKTVVKRQKEMSGPYVLYGNEYPIKDVNNITDKTKYGSTLLPNGVYQVSATMHALNGTVVDKTDFGTDIHVVSC